MSSCFIMYKKYSAPFHRKEPKEVVAVFETYSEAKTAQDKIVREELELSRLSPHPGNDVYWIDIVENKGTINEN